MNKKHILILLLLFTGNMLFSQNIGRRVISGSGGVLTESGLQLSWTIGQGGLAGTLTNSNLILTQGFEQDNDDQFVAVINIDNDKITVDLFPNPVLGDAVLKISSDINTSYSWKLFNSNGLLILSSEKELPVTQSIIEHIPTTELNPGMYYLQIEISASVKKHGLHNIKLIKI